MEAELWMRVFRLRVRFLRNVPGLGKTSVFKADAYSFQFVIAAKTNVQERLYRMNTECIESITEHKNTFLVSMLCFIR